MQRILQLGIAVFGGLALTAVLLIGIARGQDPGDFSCAGYGGSVENVNENPDIEAHCIDEDGWVGSLRLCRSSYNEINPHSGTQMADIGWGAGVVEAKIFDATELGVVGKPFKLTFWANWGTGCGDALGTSAFVQFNDGGAEYVGRIPGNCPATSGTWTQFEYTGVWGGDDNELEISFDARDHVIVIDDIYVWTCTGPDECTTVDDPDFETGTPWTLGESAMITDSILTLTTGDYARQDYLIQSQRYTVTVIAATTATNGSLVVSFLTASSQVAGTTVISVPNDGNFYTVDAGLEDLTYTGNGYLQIASNSGQYEVDWICLTPGWGSATCTSETRTFDFEDGYNVGDINWDPDAYGFSQGWRGFDYPINTLFPDNTIWRLHPLGIPSFTNGHFENASGVLRQRVAATIKYNYPVVPSVITVTSIIIPPIGSETMQLLTSPDGIHWSVADEADVSSVNEAVFTLTNSSPVYVALSDLVDTGVPLPINGAAIHEVEMTACYGGPNQFEECLVGDPDFDLADGYPSTFYWRGNYNEAAGAATMQAGGNIYQDFTPPWAGYYNLEMVASSTANPCTWGVYFTNYGSSVEIGRANIQCIQASNHTYNLTFNLPATPITLWIEQLAGNSSISRVCLTPGAGPGQCLNLNPDLAGPAGYTGDFSDAGGRIVIPADGKLAAVGVEYQRAEPPYQLDLTVSPAISGTSAGLTINHGNVPPTTVDAVYTVSTTSNLTYTLAAEISGAFGPTLWNGGDGDLSVLRYCIRPITGTAPIDPFWCETVDNPDFTDGLSGWDSDNVMAVNGIASFATDAYVSQGLGALVISPTNAKVRWLADGYASTVATLTVTSEAGTFNASHNISPGDPHFWEDSGTIDGTTSITISDVESGLELDFVCLYPGNTAPPLRPDPDGGVIPPPGGSLAECIAPPMGILPNITTTLASLWPWGGSMTHFEVLMAYNTGWVRFIGCRLDYFVTWMDEIFWGEPWRLGLGGNGLRAKLENIIFLLAGLAILSLLQTLLSLLQTIGMALDAILEGIAEAAKIGLFLIGLLGLALLALLGLLILLMAIIALIWQIPQEFWTSFRTAVTGSDAVALPLPTSPEDPLYNIILGIQVVNQVAGQTILFPIVVLAVTIGSFAILIWTIKQFGIKFV